MATGMRWVDVQKFKSYLTLRAAHECNWLSRRLPHEAPWIIDTPYWRFLSEDFFWDHTKLNQGVVSWFSISNFQQISGFLFSSAILCMVSICTLVFSWTQRCFCCQRITSRVKKGSAFQNVVEMLPWLKFSNCKNCVARRKLNIKENSSRVSYITPLS